MAATCIRIRIPVDSTGPLPVEAVDQGLCTQDGCNLPVVRSWDGWEAMGSRVLIVDGI